MSNVFTQWRPVRANEIPGGEVPVWYQRKRGTSQDVENAHGYYIKTALWIFSSSLRSRISKKLLVQYQNPRNMKTVLILVAVLATTLAYPAYPNSPDDDGVPGTVIRNFKVT